MAGLSLGLGLGLQPIFGAAGGGDPLAITGTPVTTGTDGAAYAGFTATASGGMAPYTYSLVGTWPTGISINSSTGAVSGTPSQSGSFTGLSVRVTDAASTTADLSAFTLTVAAAVPRVTMTDTDIVMSASTTKTFSGLSFGEAHADRQLFVTLSSTRPAATGYNITAVTIGGVSATKVIASTEANDSTFAQIWRAAVPTGATGDVVASIGTADTVGVSIAVYRCIDLASTTPTDTGVGTTSAACDVVAGGFILAAGVVRAATAIALSNVDVDYAASAGTGHYGTHESLISATTQTVTSALTGSTTRPNIAMAAFN